MEFSKIEVNTVELAEGFRIESIELTDWKVRLTIDIGCDFTGIVDAQRYILKVCEDLNISVKTYSFLQYDYTDFEFKDLSTGECAILPFTHDNY